MEALCREDLTGLRRRPIRECSPVSYRENESPTTSSKDDHLTATDSDSDSDEEVEQIASDLNASGGNRVSSHVSYEELAVRVKRISYEEDRSFEETDSSRKIEDAVSLNTIIITAIGVIILLLLTLYFFFFHSTSPNELAKPNGASIIVGNLKQTFKLQSNKSMKVIKIALKNILDDNTEPRSPAIMLLISSKTAEEIMSCLAKTLARKTSNGTFLSLDSSKFQKYNDDDAKEHISTKIDNFFYSGIGNVVLIEDLDKLHAEVAMALHGYCDSENAPFKRAAFILTVRGKVQKELEAKNLDKYMHDHLSKTWESMGIDQLQPLITRLIGSVANIWPDNIPSNC